MGRSSVGDRLKVGESVDIVLVVRDVHKIYSDRRLRVTTTDLENNMVAEFVPSIGEIMNKVITMKDTMGEMKYMLMKKQLNGVPNLVRQRKAYD